MKTSCKWLKTVLALGVGNFGLAFIASKLVKFPLFDNFFPDLAKFQDLDIFLLFDFFDLNNFWDLNNFLVFNNFLYFSINLLLPSTPSTSLVANTLLATNTYDDTVIFSIDISSAAILLKP